MAMPLSGSIGLKYCVGSTACSSVCAAVGGTGTASLSTLSVAAGKTAPHCMREFYGYNPSTASISLSSNNTEVFSGSLGINTITASGAWTATKYDPDGILSSFSTSGSGSQKVTFLAVSLMPPYPAEAEIEFCITASPTTRVVWYLEYND